MPRILILSASHLARNPRVVKEATTLAAAGYDTTVLTLRTHAPSVPIDAELLKNARFQLQEIDCRSPAAFLRRLSLKIHRSFTVRMGFQSANSLGPARTMLQAARRHRADLIITHNELANWVGCQLLRENQRVATDFEDWLSENLGPGEKPHSPLRLLRANEQELLAHARYTTTTSESLASALHNELGGQRPHVITNSFPLQPPPASRIPQHGPPVFFWFSQTLGPGRGLEPFLDAWARTTSPSQLVLLGHPVAGYQETLLDYAAPNFRARISFLPFVAADALSEIIARHDVGLALELPHNRNHDLTISNKLLQYLNAGLAVVATPTTGQREALSHAPDAGVFLQHGDPAANARALDALLASSDQLARRQHAARSLAASRYCWENEAPKLLHIVASALRSSA